PARLRVTDQQQSVRHRSTISGRREWLASSDPSLPAQPVRSASAWSAIVGVCLVTLLVSATGASATPASALASAPVAGLLAYRATSNGGHDIAVVSPDGSGGRIVIATPDNESQPTWSPDGRRVAFEANYDGDVDIWGMTADGTLERLAGGG